MDWILVVFAVSNLLLSFCLFLAKKSIALWKVPDEFQMTNWPEVSVVIPLKNEGEYIIRNHEALSNQIYPGKIEIIWVNDGSTDNTLGNLNSPLTSPDQKIISLEKAHGKKKALTLGIERALHPVILTTDGDCQPSPNWVASMIRNKKFFNADFVTGLVNIQGVKITPSLPEVLQSNQMRALMGVTSLGIKNNWFYMANGASMAFDKENFFKADPYRDNAHIQSGDDMYLVHSIANNLNGRIAFMSDWSGAVKTTAVNSWRAFWWQQLRWAGKNTNFPDKRIIAANSFLWMSNLTFLAAFIIILFYPLSVEWVLLIMGVGSIRLLAEYVLTKSEERSLKKWWQFFPIPFFIHMVWVLLIGTVALFKTNFKWK